MYYQVPDSYGSAYLLAVIVLGVWGKRNSGDRRHGGDDGTFVEVPMLAFLFFMLLWIRRLACPICLDIVIHTCQIVLVATPIPRKYSADQPKILNKIVVYFPLAYSDREAVNLDVRIDTDNFNLGTTLSQRGFGSNTRQSGEHSERSWSVRDLTD